MLPSSNDIIQVGSETGAQLVIGRYSVEAPHLGPEQVAPDACRLTPTFTEGERERHPSYGTIQPKSERQHGLSA